MNAIQYFDWGGVKQFLYKDAIDFRMTTKPIKEIEKGGDVPYPATYDILKRIENGKIIIKANELNSRFKSNNYIKNFLFLFSFNDIEKKEETSLEYDTTFYDNYQEHGTNYLLLWIKDPETFRINMQNASYIKETELIFKATNYKPYKFKIIFQGGK